MKLITRQYLASIAEKEWRKLHSHTKNPNNLRILEELKKLDKNPKPHDVDNIVGNMSWTCPPNCSECGESSAVIVEIGEKPDYESNTAWICKKCLTLALNEFTND
ncbi:unnamed protein product [marine sediment metagenome]|uniref:Uncharacterized protein n=1 Tax=marine sediment metagenome TaxID=412755 RepID=X0RVI5_9ZZZZ